MEHLSQGSLLTRIRFVWSYMDSIIDQIMTVYAGSRRINFDTIADWQESLG